MKTIEIDDEPYRYITNHTLYIGESASGILRHMLKFSAVSQPATPANKAASTLALVPVVEMKPANPAKDKVHVMCELLLSDEYVEWKRAVNRFILMLTTLYSLDNKAFAEATESPHGRTRVYFVEGARTLPKSSDQTKPEQAPSTPWWVITNTNTSHKYSMIEHIVWSMQFPAKLIEKVYGTIQPFNICTRKIR